MRRLLSFSFFLGALGALATLVSLGLSTPSLANASKDKTEAATSTAATAPQAFSAAADEQDDPDHQSESASSSTTDETQPVSTAAEESAPEESTVTRKTAATSSEKPRLSAGKTDKTLTFQHWKLLQQAEAKNAAVRLSNQILLLKSKKFNDVKKLGGKSQSSNFSSKSKKNLKREKHLKEKEQELQKAMAAYEFTQELTFEDYVTVYVRELAKRPEGSKKSGEQNGAGRNHSAFEPSSLILEDHLRRTKIPKSPLLRLRTPPARADPSKLIQHLIKQVINEESLTSSQS